MTSIGRKARVWGLSATVAAVAIASVASAKNWTDWGAPQSIEAIAGSSGLLNGPAVDGCASLSPDGLELYFTSSRAGGLGAVDIWMASRTSVGEGFGAPVNLGAPINGPGAEYCPTLAPGKRLYFSSSRAGGGDIFVSRRTRDGWSVPVNLGPNVNSPAVDEAPSFYEDEQGREVMVFSSRRSGRGQVYQSIGGAPAELLSGGVNSSAADQRATVSKDGLEIFWDSTRFGTLGNSDLWTATRSSTSQPWGTARHLVALSSPGPAGDGFAPGYDARPFLSRDGSMLLIGSVRDGGEGSADIYVTRRSKVTGRQ